MKLRNCILMFLIALPLAATAQEHFQSYLQAPEPMTYHEFFDRSNLKLQSVNVLSQTIALLAIQSHDDGGGMARCAKPPCTGALAARGRTLDPFEKHFESYGYGWGSVYRYGGGVGLEPRGSLHVPRQQPSQARTLDPVNRDRARPGFHRLCLDRLEPGQKRLVKAGLMNKPELRSSGIVVQVLT